jgi:hypothetical protein
VELLENTEIILATPNQQIQKYTVTAEETEDTHGLS